MFPIVPGALMRRFLIFTFTFLPLDKSEWNVVTGRNLFPTRTEHTAVIANGKAIIAGGYSGVGGYKMEVFSFDLRALSSPLGFLFSPRL